MMTCQAKEVVLGRTMRALEIENDLLSCTLLLDKGADIYCLRYKPRASDVLWKSPWGLKEAARGFDSAVDSQTAWLEAYAGGWQVLFPNGGFANSYKGVELGYHGEASMKAWDYEIVQDADASLGVKLSVRLSRSPYSLERWLRLEDGSPILHIRERITNQAGEAMDCMWSHHPAYGAPFLSEHCVIDTDARSLLSDDGYLGANNPLKPGVEYKWPLAAGLDLSMIPAPDQPRDLLGYLKDFETGWYSITNRQLGFGIGFSWDKDVFPYAWFWQELNSSPGFPFYKCSYVIAIEPATSIPGHGLTAVMEKTGTHLTLQPGESREVEMKVSFYESVTGVEHIDGAGNVTLK
ncbi:MAG: aldose 1-epimerase [Chloroflexi bacterium]|nr:aldose 1-epimerase [Chloroflexota bacterium]